MTHTKIPQTDSIEELAQFWDTHDSTNFEDELEEVSEPVFELQTAVSIPLEREELDVISTLANSRGISPVNLIREWIVEQIDVALELDT